MWLSITLGLSIHVYLNWRISLFGLSSFVSQRLKFYAKIFSKWTFVSPRLPKKKYKYVQPSVFAWMLGIVLFERLSTDKPIFTLYVDVMNRCFEVALFSTLHLQHCAAIFLTIRVRVRNVKVSPIHLGYHNSDKPLITPFKSNSFSLMLT